MVVSFVASRLPVRAQEVHTGEGRFDHPQELIVSPEERARRTAERLERKAARAEARIEMAAASAKPAPKGLAALLTPAPPEPEPRPAASLDPGLS